MSVIRDTFKERVIKNGIQTKAEYFHEQREILQEVVLAGLAQTDFFKRASFLGGTCLRIMHRIDRYSEDLDFSCIAKEPGFSWKPYLDTVQTYAAQFGVALETVDKTKLNLPIRKAFIKDSSIERMMNLPWTRKSGSPEKTHIKLELDANPPPSAHTELKKYTFPADCMIKKNDLPSLFAGKCHALLCRKYEKGRDWFDFNWFVNKGIAPNYPYLASMTYQQGPWRNVDVAVNKQWLCTELRKKIDELNFTIINKDIEAFANKDGFIVLNKDMVVKQIEKFESLQHERKNSRGRGR